MLVLATGSALAVANTIELSSEGSCARLDVPGLVTVNVFHDAAGGATGSRFRVEPGPGLAMTYVSEVHHLSQTVGNTQTGMTVCYDGCVAGRVLVATITYMRDGTSEDCSRLLIVPHPDAETAEMMDCTYEPHPMFIRDFQLVTASAGCGCPFVRVIPGTPRSFGCSPLPIEKTTWGRIKAFYRR